IGHSVPSYGHHRKRDGAPEFSGAPLDAQTCHEIRNWSSLPWLPTAKIAYFSALRTVIVVAEPLLHYNATPMAEREIRAFDYVNQPYEPVRDALKQNALIIFRRATKLAEDRSGDLAASLRVDLGGLEVARDIAITVGEIREATSGHGQLSRETQLRLNWPAAESPALSPAMHAERKVYPLSFTETQVELSGSYDPPMGVLGSAVARVVGHRLAEASVHRFVRAIVERLRSDLAE